MRALDYLVRCYPDKTGAEIMEIQKQEILEDEKKFQKHNKKLLAFVKDINTNGGYYHGRFGLDQHYFYRVFDLEMDYKGNVHMKVESLVMFCNNNDERQVTRPNEIHIGISIERHIKEYEELDNYALQNEQRVTVKEWDAVNNYLNAMSDMFWGDIKRLS